MPSTSEFILNRLTEWGVRRAYAYPGDGIDSLLGAFHKVGDRLEFIQTRHEEIAAFAVRRGLRNPGRQHAPSSHRPHRTRRWDTDDPGLRDPDAR